jgi:hypothetical protein
MGQRSGPRIIIISAILTLVIGGVGLVVTLALNAFVLDKYNAYGEVPIPGSTSLHLPAGEVTASFHTVVTGGSGSSLPVPNLHLSIFAPSGQPEVQVDEDFGTSTTVNNDARVRVWVLQVQEEGSYEITTDGDVGGYINPRLAFGHGSSYGWLTWVFAGLLAAGLGELAMGLLLSARVRKRARLLEAHELATLDQPMWSAPPPPTASGAGYAPSDQGIRLEQIRQLAALRDSGALTEEEYAAEKRRILDG